MKELLRATLWSLFIALALNVAFSQLPWVGDAGRVLMIQSGKPNSHQRAWMIIESQNGRDWKEHGFDPRLTQIVSDYMPIYWQMPNGQWGIKFFCPKEK